MQRGQKRIKTIRTFLMLAVVCSLFFSITYSTQGFVGTTTKELGLLLKRIDKPQWRIGYNFTVDCPADFRQQEEQLKETITKALQAWMQPLRERYPNRQFTDDFLLLKQPDFVECEEDKPSLNRLDTRVTFDCKGIGRSFAARSLGAAPDLCIRKAKEAGIDQLLIYALMHELGHAFGLEDTYARDRLQSTGGLAFTMGKQPAAIMAVLFPGAAPFALGEDDRNGIIWLYKYLYEDQPPDDCFFP